MTDNYTKVRFFLNPEEWHGQTAEVLWAEPVGSKKSRAFRLMNSPYHSSAASYLDIVRAEESPDGYGFDYVGTIENSGHSTIWLLTPLKSAEFTRHWEPLGSKGCTYEGAFVDTVHGEQTLYSVDVPPETNFDEIVSVLDEGHRQGAWLYQIGHRGHGSPNPTPGTA